MDRRYGITYHVGIDGISLMMVLLSTILMPLAVLGSWEGITTKERGFYGMLLLLTTGMLGVFMALDLFLFYVFWEVMLIPMYFIIGIWAGRPGSTPAIKFFIYTMAGSLLMLVAILFIWPVASPGQRGDALPSASSDHLLANPAAAARAAPRLLRRLRARLRDQGADGSVPHLAARRPRRGAHGGLGDPGRRPPQDGHLRLHPVRRAALPGRRLSPDRQRRDDRARRHRHRLRRAGRDGPAGLQAAGRLLVGEPPGLRDARDLGR